VYFLHSPSQHHVSHAHRFLGGAEGAGRAIDTACFYICSLMVEQGEDNMLDTTW
jgi:hypothetical protein